MAAEELVERVLAGDVDREPAAAPPGAPPHLAQRGDRAGERHADRRVERADVDPQLERVGRDDAEQVAGRRAAPRARAAAAACSRRGTARSARRAPPRPRSSSASWAKRAISSTALRDFMKTIVRAPPLTSSASRSAASASAERRVASCLVDDRRVPHRDRLLRAGRAVAVDDGDVVEARQPLGELARVGDRRAREQEARLGPVGGGDPPQPAQHVRDVRAEHAAIDVRLVDHDDREVGEHVRPRPVVGQDAEVEHVRVREDHVRAPADLRALLARRVAVVDRRPRALDAERRAARAPGPARAPSSGRGRARGRGVAAQRVQRRELEAERLAARGPGRDDRRPGPRRVQRLRLVRPELLDAAARAARPRPAGAARPAARRRAPARRFCAACMTSRSSSRPAASSSSHGSMSRTTAIAVRLDGCSAAPTSISTARCWAATARSCTMRTAASACSARGRSRRATGPAWRSSCTATATTSARSPAARAARVDRRRRRSRSTARSSSPPTSPRRSRATCAPARASRRTRSRSAPTSRPPRSSGRTGWWARDPTRTRCSGWSSTARPNVRLVESAGGGPALYEAVVTTLAEQRG